jgi:hypothetical protein
METTTNGLMFMLLIQEKFAPDTRKVFEKMEQAA